jgi:hypothetical protein
LNSPARLVRARNHDFAGRAGIPPRGDYADFEIDEKS